MPKYFDEDLIIGRYIRPFCHPRESSIKLWRYIPFEHLRDFFEKQSLYLRRIDSFPDRLEGVLPIASEEDWRSDWIKKGRSMEELPAFLERYEIRRYLTYASCWRMDTEESIRAWNEYCTHSNSIAIQTTFARLSTALPQALPISASDYPIGCIRYIDRLAQGIPLHNVLLPQMFKDTSYLWEDEIRILKWDDAQERLLREADPKKRNTTTPVSLYVPLDTNVVIEAVYHRQKILPNELEELMHLVDKHSPNTKVIKSRFS